MGKTLYLDCTCGISGDMTVAALLDLGGNEARLRDALASLPVDGYEVRVSRVAKAGLDCCDFDVVLDAAHENHDHDMAYLFGGEHALAHAQGHDGEQVLGHAHAHGHEHEHAQCHGHDHAHRHDDEHHHGHDHGHGHAHHHEHRGPADIDRIIDAGRLAPRARDLAHRMVSIIAAAEAKAHGVSLDEVHFHEVGAVDSIVDIVSVAVLIDDLDIDRVIVPRLVDGRGTIRCQHGVIPVPVPATLNIVQQQGLSLTIGDVEGELVTPTGAAIVAALDAERKLPARFTVKQVGFGSGKRSYEVPSILRAIIIEDEAPLPQDSIVRLECDIDDATGEQLGYAADALRAAGAREVHWAPVFTKKGRPAWQLQVIASPEDAERFEGIIFAETGTIGIRRWLCERSVLRREQGSAETPWGTVRTKVVTLPDGETREKPEFDDCAALAAQHGVSLRAVQDAVAKAGER
ncbi:nickel pincer cofactor biosynthesis protein LarC [Enorma phocaeensis]|uniref:nickel pincer cofactor biosynthesis protein LarC n=1 Tax=Enorma phocaeensis TaxID=1871019 RepID=UPI000C81CC35|nr:nickel pincer cofactor biosynthesis protein LarC [Enorma phocaeensis]